jgi:DNA-directed RNA polymerase, mitochondrial
MSNEQSNPATQPARVDEQHPLWERQVQLEERIADRISQATNKRWDEVVARDAIHTTRGGRMLVNGWHTAMQEKLISEITKPASRGPVAIDRAFIKRCPDLSALCKITIQTCLQTVAGSGEPLAGLGSKIGDAAEELERVHIFKKTNPHLYRWLLRSLKEDEATVAHKKVVTKHTFNKRVAPALENNEFTPWSREEKIRVGLRLVDMLCAATGGRFKVTERSLHKETLAWRKDIKRNPLVLEADKETTEWIRSAMRDDKTFVAASLLPLLIPPRKIAHGSTHVGYHTGLVPPLSLVSRRKADKVLESGSQVYDAINFLNATAWRVNKRVLAVAEWAWKFDNGVGGLPKNQYQDIPPAPANIDEDHEAKIRWKRIAKLAYHNNETRVRKTLRTSRTIAMARDYVDEQAMYFPHYLDFRGRCYPFVPYLSPQGNDLAKGLLTFAEKKRCGPDGVRWLKIHTANCWGKDKLTMDERVAFVDSIRGILIAVASDPIHNLEWADMSDPWQALAAAFECSGLFQEGEDFQSSLPVVVDGSCNGLQHLSALSRDEETGMLVNVLPSESKRDIYLVVAEAVTNAMVDATMYTNGDEHVAKHFLEMVDADGMLPRAFAKRPTMAFPYGLKLRGYMDEIWKYVKQNHKELLASHIKDQRKQMQWLAKITMLAVKSSINRPAEVQDLLTGLARITTKCKRHVEWRLPTGFTCRQNYTEVGSKQIRVTIDGETRKVRIISDKIEMKVSKEISAIAPNFVHSLDAAALCLAVVRMKRQGNASAFLAIHDGYGTHASNSEELAAAIRSAFAELHCDNDVLKELYLRTQGLLEANAMRFVGDDKQPEMPRFIERGDMDVRQVEHSKYFFA